MNKIITGDIRNNLYKIKDGSCDLIFVDPPYLEGFTSMFDDFKKKLNESIRKITILNDFSIIKK